MSVPQYEPGKVLPGTVYRVVRHLATGGMGSVYDVEDVTVEKRYVLKTLHPSLVSREDLALRLRDEARSLAKLAHPNIVDVVTAGITTDAQKVPFYVMERLIGQNLRIVLDKTGGLHLLHAYRIAIDIADALEHAHENNIVHRDVKPENIFLHRNANGTTTTKLLDFGIVRLLDRKANPTQGKFIGTLRYASPEQISGRAVGPSTDIYSLGLVLFEMLSGRGPFDDAGDAYAIGSAHANDHAPLLSEFVDVRPDVERLVASTLAKDPSQRPRDCFTLATELRRILREEEASPRVSTAANLLSSAPPVTPVTPLTPNTPPADNDRTHDGMIPPSAVASVEPEALEPPPATRVERDAPVSPIAPTLAADDDPAAARGGSRPTPAPAAGRPIDRSAPTRASVPAGVKRPIAENGTWMDSDGVASDDDVRSATDRGDDLVFPPIRPPSATGPTAGEARTRPPGERGHYLLLVASAVISLTLIGGAVYRVQKRARVAAPPTSVSPIPVETVSSAILEPAPAAPPPTAVATAAAASVEPSRGTRPAQRVMASATPASPPPPTPKAGGAVRPAKGSSEGKPKAPAAGGATTPAVPFEP